MRNTSQQIRWYIRLHARVAAYFIFGLVTSWLCAALWYTAIPHLDLYRLVRGEEQASSDAAYSLEQSVPVRIEIPTINLTAPFTDALGVDEAGAIEVPNSFTSVGWYKHGPTPGELGPAVVLGHVDSYSGPAVFHDLAELELGDRISIIRADGSTAVFVIERTRVYTDETFDTQAVYGDIDYAGLRLITCTGVYDHGTLRYSHNLVVFARLVESAR